MDELNQINKKFNDTVDDGFSLTKMFKNNGLLSKTINSLLVMSMTVGAFSGVHKIAEMTEPASVHYSLVKEAQASFSNTTVITVDNIAELANSGEDNIYKVENNDQLIVVANGKTFDSGNEHKNEIANDLIELNQIKTGSSPHATFGKKLYNSGVPMTELMTLGFEQQDSTDMSYLVLQDNFLSKSLIKDNPEKYPILSENDNLFVFAHELNHVTKQQQDHLTDYTSEKHDPSNMFDQVLSREVASDLFAALVIIKVNDFDLKESTQLLQEIDNMRFHNLMVHNDYEHATSIGIKPFNKLLNSSPEMLEQIKNADLQQFDSISMNLGNLSLRELNAETNNNDKIQDIKPDFQHLAAIQAYDMSFDSMNNFMNDAQNVFEPTQGIDQQENQLLAELQNNSDGNTIAALQKEKPSNNKKLKL